MAISIQVAQTPQEQDDVFRLRYDVYVLEDGKFQTDDLPEKRIFDRYDTYSPYNVNLIAYDGTVPVGTIRFTEDSELGLPQEELVDVDAIRRTRTHAGKLFGVGMLAVRESHRHRMGFITSLLKYLIALVRIRNGTDAVITINYVIEKMMARLGFRRIGEKFYSERIKNYIVPMYGNMEDVADNFREDRLAHELTKFADSFRRKIFNKGEIICVQGDPGDEAYVVIRGSVGVFVAKGKGAYRVATLGPGELIGEMSLIDNQPRSATLKANARETELMVLSRSAFEDALYDRETVVGILKMATRRLRTTSVLATAEERKEKRAKDLVKLLQDNHRINAVFQDIEDQPQSLTLESAAEDLGAEVNEIRPYWNQLLSAGIIEEGDAVTILDYDRLQSFSFEIELNAGDAP